jgi:hypothetical protein
MIDLLSSEISLCMAQLGLNQLEPLDQNYVLEDESVFLNPQPQGYSKSK